MYYKLFQLENLFFPFKADKSCSVLCNSVKKQSGKVSCFACLGIGRKVYISLADSDLTLWRMSVIPFFFTI